MQLRLLVFLSLALVALSSCRMLERSFLYRPSSAKLTAESWRLPAEAAKLSTPDGETLDAWWVPNPKGRGPAVLLLPGRRGFRSRHVPNVRVLWEAGASVLVLQYRGFGDSTGSPSEEGVITDGTTAFDWLRNHVGDKPIVVLGRSLGAAVATQVALRRDVAGLVLESAFTSVRDMARKMVDIPGIEYIVATDFDNVEALRQTNVPLVIIHGTDDTLIPIEMGYALFQAAGAKQKRFYEVRGASHWNTHYLAGNVYRDWLGSMERSNCATQVC